LPARKAPADLKKLRKAVTLALKKAPAFIESAPVFGEGPCPCDLMVVGEAPGRKETELKKPFVGRSGGFFTAILKKVLKRSREEIYITNVVKVWPRLGTKRGRTRPPTKAEEAFFLPYLKHEIEAVRPRVVIAVGKTAFNALAPASEFRPGVWVEGPDDFLIMPVYHPAYILRKQKNLIELKGGLEVALRKVKKRLVASERFTRGSGSVFNEPSPR
jgi:DNA polymerase